jgi:hypothetical protein
MAEKFEFDPEFQEVILKFTVTDKKGYKALQLYSDTYFDMLHHAVIAAALKRYFKKNKKVPEKAFLKEYIRHLYNSHKDFAKVGKEDKKEINETIERIYDGPTTGGEEVLEKVRRFAQFVNFKAELEQINVLDYDQYEKSINKLKAAINIGREDEKESGIYVVGGMPDRAHKRDLVRLIYETPFRQLNKLLNSGGLAPGSLIMLMGEAKRFKTGLLLNLCKFFTSTSRTQKKLSLLDQNKL